LRRRKKESKVDQRRVGSPVEDCAVYLKND
jgi:hypothetical protein